MNSHFWSQLTVPNTTCVAIFLQLDEVKTLDVINVTIFPEYILPALQSFPLDKEVLVRSTYAGCIAQFAQTAMHYLELAQVSEICQLHRKCWPLPRKPSLRDDLTHVFSCYSCLRTTEPLLGTKGMAMQKDHHTK